MTAGGMAALQGKENTKADHPHPPIFFCWGILTHESARQKFELHLKHLGGAFELRRQELALLEGLEATKIDDEATV